jgi:methanogenic corrinoid protein MtbC1
MEIADTFAQYLEHLFAGKRCQARELIRATLDRGVCARKLLQVVIWPAMEQIQHLYHQGRINRLMEHMATRINRMIADQLQGHMGRDPKNGLRLLVTCGDGEVEELGAQITADLFEATGWSVWFIGSGVPNDEVMEMLAQIKPDVLCVYGTQPSGVPNVRKLIELVREIGAYEQMQILVTGGVFNRAEGLDEEIRADLYAPDARRALNIVQEHPVRIPRPDVPQPGRRRKRRSVKRRQPARQRRATKRRQAVHAVS